MDLSKFICLIKMDSPKVIITKKKIISNENPIDIEVGLSTYDLALISVNKIAMKNKVSIKDDIQRTFLI